MNTTGDELAQFQPQTNKKKSRFQVPEVSKLWFFNQNQDAYENEERNEYVNVIRNEPKLEIRYKQAQPNMDHEQNVDNEQNNNEEDISISGGDDVVFHPDPASPERGFDIESLISPPSTIECFTSHPLASSNQQSMSINPSKCLMKYFF